MQGQLNLSEGLFLPVSKVCVGFVRLLSNFPFNSKELENFVPRVMSSAC